MIRELDERLSEYIKSQQYIHNTYTIVKELIENSLDSQATTIKIHVDESSIRVDDNGVGIKDLSHIGERGYTTKEDTAYYVIGYNDNLNQVSCGYRGMALCSLKNMCDVTITTSHTSSSIGYKKLLGSDGFEKCAREQGTTVTATNIFKNCPIRQRICKKTFAQDVKKILDLVESYSLVYSTNFVLKHKGKQLCSIDGYNSLQAYCNENYKQCISSCLEANTPDFYLFFTNKTEKKNHSKIFYKKRVIFSKQLVKEIKAVYNLFMDGYPVFYLELKCRLDFNISPDKSEVLIENNAEVVCKIKEVIRSFLCGNLYYSTREHKTPTHKSEVAENVTRNVVRQKHNFARNSTCIAQPDTEILGNDKREDSYQELIDNFISSEIVTKQDVFDVFSLSSTYNSVNHDLGSKRIKVCSFDKESNTQLEKEVLVDTILDDDKNEHIDEISALKLGLANTLESKKQVLETVDKSVEPRYLIERSRNEKSFEEEVDFLSSPRSTASCTLADTIYDYINQQERKEIALHIEKSDFGLMTVVGQFNKGFILVSLVKDKEYLILIDQHAADEIYNYETIIHTSKIRKQKLIIPYKLDISILDKMVVRNNLHTFDKFGYMIEGDHLTTVPVYNGNEFGIEEFNNLLENIKNGLTQIDKIHHIAATKACRMSVMVGEHLDKYKLQKIVKNLENLDKPWKCPHGRPVLTILDEAQLR